MNHRIKSLSALAAAMMLGLTMASAAPALSATMSFTGRVVHVSTDNIKVEAPRSGTTMSFIVVPHFDQVFQFDGKTTYQMKRIRPGAWVRVRYDERVLGMRHADRIVVLNHAHRA
jgi:hypothetical protein